MQKHVPNTLDPRLLGQRLQNARKVRGLTQQEVADALDVARTTVTALEKGDRRLRPDELLQLARLYGRQVGDLVGSRPATGDFTVQFRAAVAQAKTFQTDKVLEQAVETFRRLCEDYLYLENVNGTQLARHYPEEYAIDGSSPEDAAEDVAATERNRLGLGDGPLLNLQETLENDAGIRIFGMELPDKVVGICAYTDELGACVAVNAHHPATRCRRSLAHEYGHFLTRRYEAAITVMTVYRRIPASERFADSFARSFLMPATGLRRRLHQVARGAGGKLTAADVCRVAHFYRVSCAAMMLRLEELRLVARGTWERWQDRGFKDQEARAQSGLAPIPDTFALVSFRYQFLVVQAFMEAKLTEGELAHLLRTDRVTARRTVQRLRPTLSLPDDGADPALGMNLSSTSSIRRVQSGGKPIAR